MDFKTVLFDIYYLAEKVQNYSNELCGLEFADERGHINDSERDKLRSCNDSLEEARKIAESRLQTARIKHSDDLTRHLDNVIEHVTMEKKYLKEKKDDKLRYDIQMLEELIIDIKNIQLEKTTKYSIWWVFFYIQFVLSNNQDFRFSGKGLKKTESTLSPCCPSCSFQNDITSTIDIFLPPIKAPWEKVTILDEYQCANCHQRFRVMFIIHLKDPVTFEIIRVDLPPVSFSW